MGKIISGSARSVLALLDQRHSKDLFVPECKDGPTMLGGHLRMDAWAMKKSWTSPVTWAYEIKVSRSDFLRDDKWPGYLDLCNQFYFVCPWGLIDPSEVDEKAGLMYVTKTGTRLMMKKKAPHRDVQIPEELYRYILMARCQVVDNWHGAGNSHLAREFWQRWLEKKQLDHEFGHYVSSAISKRVRDEIDAVTNKQRVLESRLESYAALTEFLQSIGIDPEKSHWLEGQAKRRIEEVREVITHDRLLRLEKAADTLKATITELAAMREGPQT